ncbi:MAG TPA: beta-ketoacyl-ACP synthase III [bacterium]|nr:beta-ketoacyl-ACP synthase III [bacterium]HPJ72041.1 beta-ketoacyl-ACP synthase III [bacterium]HPQ66090.1 beta-ketoacyl-ACP synthase III [bacterium]
MQTASIIGTGLFLPEKVLSNADLEKMVDTSDEWIVTRTGIRERRIASEEETVSYLAEQASRRAVAAAGLELSDIDCILLGTFTADKPLPAAGCLLQARLGLSRIPAFDYSAACTAFIYGVEIARGFLSLGCYRNILLVAAEKVSAVVDWSDRNTCVLFGDGAGAAVIAANGSRGRIVDNTIGADGSREGLLEIPAGGSARPVTHEVLDQRLNCIHMAGRETFKVAVASMADACQLLLDRNGLGPDDITWLVPHQANLRIMKAVAKGTRIPEERVYINVDRLGNMSGATVPIALAEMDRDGILKPGDRIMLVAFGGGLTWGATLIEW